MLKELQTYLHCFTCRNFRQCKIKYCPLEGDIFTNVSLDGTYLVLSDPEKCLRPLKSLSS